MNKLINKLEMLKDLSSGGYGVPVTTETLQEVIEALKDREAEVEIEETVFSLKPDTVYATAKCGKCGCSLHVKTYDLVAWNEYMRDHFKPDLPNYCKDCGTVPVYKKGE